MRLLMLYKGCPLLVGSFDIFPQMFVCVNCYVEECFIQDVLFLFCLLYRIPDDSLSSIINFGHKHIMTSYTQC